MAPRMISALTGSVVRRAGRPRRAFRRPRDAAVRRLGVRRFGCFGLNAIGWISFDQDRPLPRN
jgi:hypothetical protein